MSDRLQQLAQRIRVELAEIESVVRRIEAGWERVQRSHDDHYLDGVALNIHGFYSGLERTFELIAAYVDGAKNPQEKTGIKPYYNRWRANNRAYVRTNSEAFGMLSAMFTP